MVEETMTEGAKEPTAVFEAEIEIAKIEHPLIEAARMYARTASNEPDVMAATSKDGSGSLDRHIGHHGQGQRTGGHWHCGERPPGDPGRPSCPAAAGHHIFR